MISEPETETPTKTTFPETTWKEDHHLPGGADRPNRSDIPEPPLAVEDRHWMALLPELVEPSTGPLALVAPADQDSR